MRVRESKYKNIALDIAYRIVNGELAIDSKLSGRSKFSSEYNVSPETIRKSVSLLKAAGVVEVSEKKGILIKSVEMADLYIKHNDSIKSLSQLNSNIANLVKEKRKIEDEINKNLQEVIDSASKMKTQKDITPYEIQIFKESWIVGKALKSLNVWAKTGCTIIAIKRDNETMISPSPDMELIQNDLMLFVCESQNINNMFDFIYNV